MASLARRIRSIGGASGLDAMGIAGVAPFAEARAALEERRAAGLSAGMQFTYRNPARSTEPARIVEGASALVVGARRYLRRPPPPHAGEGPQGRVARYSWIDHYAPLRCSLTAVADHLRAEGWRAKVVVDDNALVDRAAAHRAGLGWYGKNTMLLLPGAGSWFVLGSVVTDAPLPAAPQAHADGCGSCTRCGTACPTGALDTPGVLDARRCLAWLVQAPGVFPVEQRVALGDRFYGCDDCQDACPVNSLGARRDPPPDAENGTQASIDALEVLASADAELLARWGRWYIPGRDPAHLRRNALLVVANVADPAAAPVRAAVERCLLAAEPLVRAHAVWAARRLGYDDLLHLVEADTEPMVIAEVAAERAVPRRSRPGAPV